MDEYIKRETLLAFMHKNGGCFPWEVRETYKAMELITECPTADVVEVVRCGECIHRGNLQECDGRPLDWYCPNGVRKGEGEW